MSKREQNKISIRVYMTRAERKVLKKTATEQNISLTKYVYNIIKTAQSNDKAPIKENTSQETETAENGI